VLLIGKLVPNQAHWCSRRALKGCGGRRAALARPKMALLDSHESIRVHD
jgi:hypothetical protein